MTFLDEDIRDYLEFAQAVSLVMGNTVIGMEAAHDMFYGNNRAASNYTIINAAGVRLNAARRKDGGFDINLVPG